MTKRYDELIDVTSEPGIDAPIAFAWRGRRYEVDKLLDAWRMHDPSNGSAPDRDYVRVLARPAGTFAAGDLDADGFMCGVGAVYDLYLDRARRAWRLARIWD